MSKTLENYASRQRVDLGYQSYVMWR